MELKIEKAFIRTVFQSPSYTGDLNGMLVLGFIPPKELTTSMFNDGFIKQMLLLSAIDPTYDPIALKHHQTGQTISVKAIARLADFEEELARFLFSDPNGFTPRYSYQKHITAENFDEAFAGSYRSPTISPLPEPTIPTDQSLEDSLLRVENWGMASSIRSKDKTSEEKAV